MGSPRGKENPLFTGDSALRGKQRLRPGCLQAGRSPCFSVCLTHTCVSPPSHRHPPASTMSEVPLLPVQGRMC